MSVVVSVNRKTKMMSYFLQNKARIIVTFHKHNQEECKTLTPSLLHVPVHHRARSGRSQAAFHLPESKWLNRGDPWPQGPADEGEGGFHFIDSYNNLLMKRWKRVVVCQCF